MVCFQKNLIIQTVVQRQLEAGEPITTYPTTTTCTLDKPPDTSPSPTLQQSAQLAVQTQQTCVTKPAKHYVHHLVIPQQKAISTLY